MRDITFELACVEAQLPAIQFDNGSWLFHAHTVCEFADLAHKGNVARWIKDNIPKKWIVEFKRPGFKGRPALYLTLPGFLFSLSQGNSETALNFRDEVYELILPEIITKGGYIAPTASNEQLEALQQRITFLQKERDVLKSWSPDMSMHKIRLLEIINYKGEEYSPFLERNGKRLTHMRDFELQEYCQEMGEKKLFQDLIDTLFTGEKLDLFLEGFTGKNAFENFMKKLPVKLFRVLTNQYRDFKRQEHPKPAKQYEQFQFSVELKNEYGQVWLEYVPEKEEMLKSYLFESERQLVG